MEAGSVIGIVVAILLIVGMIAVATSMKQPPPRDEAGIPICNVAEPSFSAPKIEGVDLSFSITCCIVSAVLVAGGLLGMLVAWNTSTYVSSPNGFGRDVAVHNIGLVGDRIALMVASSAAFVAGFAGLAVAAGVAVMSSKKAP